MGFAATRRSGTKTTGREIPQPKGVPIAAKGGRFRLTTAELFFGHQTKCSSGGERVDVRTASWVSLPVAG
jgi:hypothetical protein